MKPALRICIDVSAAVHQRAGLGRYAQELVKGLVDLGRGEALPGARVIEVRVIPSDAPGHSERREKSLARPTAPPVCARDSSSHALSAKRGRTRRKRTPRNDTLEVADALPLHITAFYHQRGAARLEPPIDQLPRLTTRLSVRPWRLTTALAYFSGLAQDRLFGDTEIFHATEHLLPRLRHIRSVFTLHDLIFQFDPDSHKPLNIAFLKTLMPRFLRAADAIIAVSDCSKRDAVRLYNIPPDKIRVIYEGVDPKFTPVTDAACLSEVCAKYNLPDRCFMHGFIVHVGTIEPRKNLPLLFKAVKELNQPLVVAGKLGWLTEPILAKVKELDLEDHVIFTGFVADEDLPALISAATVLAMPSKYEGFGLPVLEAMACGTPVVASNTSSLPEVGGDAALYARPGDVQSWINLLGLVTNDADLRSMLRERGIKQAAKFKWATMARETAEVYRAVPVV